MARLEHRNHIERFIGKGGLSFLRLSHVSGFSVVLSEYGAHVVSWTSPEENELLFTSEAATYEVGKPIRGGIPIVFPQFGKGALPQHGFARLKQWKIVREQLGSTDAVSVTLRLNSDEESEKLWSHPFTVELDVVLTDVLLMSLRVINTGRNAFSFTSAFHNYFRVRDVARVAIRGLRDVEYSDFLRERRAFMETRERIDIAGHIDRAYRDSPQTIVLDSPPENRSYLITKEGFSDTVVWNPWDVNSQSIVDMRPEEYHTMVCLESGNILTPVVLEPGDVHASAQILRVESL
jgi:glucose-6-phosphate 1-epimerase